MIGALLDHIHLLILDAKLVSGYDQEMPQSQTTDKPMAPRGRATQQSRDTLSTVKSRLSERRLSETTGLFEDDGQSWIFSLLSSAIKLPIIRISIIRKNQFSEVIRRSRLKKVLLNYPSRFEVQKSRMVIMISLFGRVWFTYLSELANKVATGN